MKLNVDKNSCTDDVVDAGVDDCIDVGTNDWVDDVGKNDWLDDVGKDDECVDDVAPIVPTCETNVGADTIPTDDNVVRDDDDDNAGVDNVGVDNGTDILPTDFSSLKWANHFKKIRNTCNNMKPTVGHTRFGKSSTMFIQQYKTGNKYYLVRVLQDVLSYISETIVNFLVGESVKRFSLNVVIGIDLVIKLLESFAENQASLVSEEEAIMLWITEK
ncbi:hypothetical protein Lser_V15G04869 [Lactuca serriola]